jgi:hypothetical protein
MPTSFQLPVLGRVICNISLPVAFGPGFSATQNIYQLYQQNLYNEANALYALDMADTTTGAGINPNQAYPSNRFFHDQFSALYAWRSIGNSDYNALEVVYRQRFGLGLQADFNYTLSKSLDATSQAERLGSSGSTNNAQIFNTWLPDQLYGQRHQQCAFRCTFGLGKDRQLLAHLFELFCCCCAICCCRVGGGGCSGNRVAVSTSVDQSSGTGSS